jgi:hypothetical protein
MRHSREVEQQTAEVASDEMDSSKELFRAVSHRKPRSLPFRHGWSKDFKTVARRVSSAHLDQSPHTI